MDYDKLLISIASIFVGWFLAQFTGILKEYLYRRKIKKCLIEELKEIKRELERTILIYSRQLQIHALKGIDNNSPIHLSHHIFKNYYKDVVLSLNMEQRISFQLIHSYIENINAGIDEHHEITRKLQEKNMIEGADSITEKDGVLWGNKVISEFTNAATAIWHIKYHLSNSQSPSLDPYTEKHEQYLKYLQSVEKEISNIMEGAKNLSREDFKKTYDPEGFAKKFL
jgi:hypothetical protein